MKVIILDYSCSRVAIIKDVPEEICNNNSRMEKFLSSNGFHPSNCSWMSVNNWECNDVEVFKYRANCEHVGCFDINTCDTGNSQQEELAEGDVLEEGEELNY